MIPGAPMAGITMTSTVMIRRIRADTLVSAQAIAPESLEMFLDLLRSAHGPNLLRMKGNRPIVR
jgi:G3E family GTPase